MRQSIFLSLPLLFAFGCSGGDADDDGDGLTNDEEADLGTDPASDDSDGDGVLDGDEVGLGTDPLTDDSDGDGVLDGDEVALGTDPLGEDSDGDGLLDGEEVDAGSSPLSTDSDGDGVDDMTEFDEGSDLLNPYSWPGSGIWPDFRHLAEEHGADGEEYAIGSVVPDFESVDQYGNEISLYQFYGNVMLLDFSAGWCQPCRQTAAGAQEMWEGYRDEGFVIMHLMIDDNSGAEPDVDFAMDWADQYGIEFPVLSENRPQQVYNNTSRAGINEGYIPYMLMLRRDFSLYAAEASPGDRTIEGWLEELLAEELE